MQYFVEMETPLWDCIFCGEPKASKEEQRVHLKDCSERPAWEDFCAFCGDEFPSKQSLATHSSRWCKERPSKSWLCMYLWIYIYWLFQNILTVFLTKVCWILGKIWLTQLYEFHLLAFYIQYRQFYTHLYIF